MRLLGVIVATVVFTALAAWLLILGWFVQATASVVDTIVIEPLREARALTASMDEVRALLFVLDADWEYVAGESVSREVVTVRVAPGATEVEVMDLWCDILLDIDASATVYHGERRHERPKRRDCPTRSPSPQGSPSE